ncbi:MAG TPA: hotdog fold domain-containing protein [bacterium]|nr:hotdog fold domain-containing protein [bacterium]
MKNGDVGKVLKEKFGDLKELEMGRYGRSFVSGEPEGDRIRVRYYFRESDGHFFSSLSFGSGAEGPPGHAHGGGICAVLDEAMGAVSWLNGNKAVSARLTVQFRKMIPLGERMIVETWVDSVNRRKVNVGGKIFDFDDEVYADAAALFVVISTDRFGKRAGGAAPGDAGGG